MSFKIQSYHMPPYVIVCGPTGKCMIHKETMGNPLVHNTNNLSDAMLWCNEQNAIAKKQQVASDTASSVEQFSSLRKSII